MRVCATYKERLDLINIAAVFFLFFFSLYLYYLIMKPSDRSLIKSYFDSCIESDTTPSYSDFISHHFKFLQGNIDCNDPKEFNCWYNNFVSVAQQYNIKAVSAETYVYMTA